MDIFDKHTKKLIKAIVAIDNEKDCEKFLKDAFTIKEIQEISQRIEVAEMLDAKKVYCEIEKETGASTATISRVNKCLIYGEGGYKTVLDKIEK